MTYKIIISMFFILVLKTDRDILVLLYDQVYLQVYYWRPYIIHQDIYSRWPVILYICGLP